MKHVASLLSLAALLILVGCSDTPTAPSPELAVEAPGAAGIENPTEALSKKKVVHHASVGGADICEALGLPTGCDANFSLVANMKADGSVSGQWQDTFAGGGEGIHVAIDCLNVDGNEAWVSGVITHGTAGGVDVSGAAAITRVADNGTSANDPADQLSFSYFDDPRFQPPSSFDCNDAPEDLDLFDLARGQVKVR